MKRDPVSNLMPPELLALTRFCQAALIMLNARMFTLLGMCLCAALFGWTMLDPHWIRFAGACAFAGLVYLPALRMEVNRIKQENDNG